MTRIALATPLAVLLVVGLPACDGTTEPEPTVPVKVLHAAPGVGVFDVLIEGDPRGMVSAGDVVADTVPPGELRVDVERSPLGLGVAAELRDGEALGAVLMDSSSPTLMAYPSVATGSGARILVINAVPGSSMSVQLEAPRTGGEVGGLEYQEGIPIDLSPDVYNIDAWPTGTADTMRLDRVTIPGGRPFVVIYPNPEGTLPWSVAVF